MAEWQAMQSRRPIKGSHALATLGAMTECGGEVVTATSPLSVRGHRIACVGDLVRYPDGRETIIVCGAGSAVSGDGKPLALVGSLTANGDMIVASLQVSVCVQEFADRKIAGLFVSGYRAPAGAPGCARRWRRLRLPISGFRTDDPLGLRCVKRSVPVPDSFGQLNRPLSSHRSRPYGPTDLRTQQRFAVIVR